MRSSSLLTAIAVAGALLVAPSPAAGQLTLAVGGGVTFSEFTGDAVDDDLMSTRTGFNAGALLGIPLNDLFSIGAGAYFVQKGADLEAAIDLQSPGSLEIDYLEIPVLLFIRVTRPSRPVGLSFFAGPQLSFELSCDFTFDDGSPERSCEDEGSDVQSTDFGGIFGAGVDFDLGQGGTSLFVNGGLDVSFTDAFEDEGDIRNSAYFIDAGVKWPIGG